MTAKVEQRSRLGADERAGRGFDAATIAPAGERALEILNFLNDLFDGLTEATAATDADPPSRSPGSVERIA